MSATAPEAEPARSGTSGEHQRPTRVVVPLGSRTPPAWIVALLERVESDPRLHLRVVLVDEGALSPTPSSPPSSRARLVRRLLRSPLVDSPRFAGDARGATPLPAAIDARLESPPSDSAGPGASPDGRDADDAPDDAAGVVLLDLGVRDETLEAGLPPDTPLWSVGAEHLEARVEKALLARAPLFHLHVRARPAGEPDARWRVLATHALPRQSYSISDLVGAAYRSLPGVLVARLGWFAEGRDPRDVEEASLPARDAGDDVGDEATFRRERAEVVREAGAQVGRTARGATLEAPSGTARAADLVAAVRLLAHRNVARVVNRMGPEHWQLAVSGDARTETGGTPAASVLGRLGTIELDDWRAIEPPPDRLWADPHLVRHAGETHAFFEELVLGESRARIVTARLDARGVLAEPPRPALTEPFHLSYPHVFEHDGAHWMLPETAGRRGVGLYRATRFPDEWTRSHDLLTDVDLADSTLHRHDGRWWLFTNRFTDRSVDERDELLIFFADALTGPWRPHALNPVVTGVDRARMAGPVLEEDGRRYRPSQYGAVRYGHGINLSRIDALTPDDYREVPVRRLVPHTGSRWLGCHSIASDGTFAVIDRVERRPWWRRPHRS